MIWNHLPPPTQVSVGELYMQGIEKTEGGGEPFSMGKAMGGTQIIRQHRDCGTLYNICTLLPLPPRWSSGRKTFLCTSQDDGIWRDLLSMYRECDEDRSSESAIGEGGEARNAPLCKLVSSKRRVRAAHGRAREAKTH